MKHIASALRSICILTLVAGIGGQASAMQLAEQEQTRTAEVNGTEVGQRVAKDDNPKIDVTARINSRIESRVQNRVRNRVDRTYDPNADATSAQERATRRVSDASFPQ